MNFTIFFTILFGLLKKGYFVNPFLIYSQAVHETGNFTSAIYKENNNLFGMKQARVRENTATGENRGHATYNSLFDSVIDYILRQKNFNIKAQLFQTEIYINDTFNSGYAEDTSYMTKWRNLYKSINPMYKYLLYALIVLLPFGFIAFLLYLIFKEKY